MTNSNFLLMAFRKFIMIKIVKDGNLKKTYGEHLKKIKHFCWVIQVLIQTPILN